MDNSLDSDDARRQTKLFRTHQLPEDIIMEILLRLPVKSVIRFRCVSKSWYLLLTSSDFSTKHLQHTRRRFYLMQVDESNEPYGRSRPTIGNDWDDKPRYFVLAPDDNLHRLVYIDHPNPQIYRIDDRQIEHLLVIGSVDGLFCISLNYGAYIIMWNPATRQSYQLPGPGVRTPSILGLGRYQDNGYKVVKVVFRGKLYRANAEVYDSYSNLWHKIADTPKSLSFLTYVCTIANGVPYWPSNSHSIIWFDPIHDTFGRMKLPVGLFELNSIDDRFVGLGVIRGELAVLVSDLNDMTLDVWMMDQRHGCVPISWTKQFRVDSKAVPRVYRWLTCWKDGELVFQTADGLHRLVCLYDYWRGETKMVPAIRSCRLTPNDVFLYEESLISPHPSC